MPEVWLRGPVPGVAPDLQPVVHALMQVEEDVVSHCSGLSAPIVWASPGGAASIGFHIRHLAGSLDRLLTYARDQALSPAQMSALAAEGDPGVPPEPATALVDRARAAIASAIAQVAATPVADLDLPRAIGRRRLPSTVRGLLVHAAEHAARHAGQIVTTAKIVAAMPGIGASRIASWLEAAVDGDPWHGPSIASLLIDVTADDAARRAPDGGHGIWELVLHMTSWTREVHRRLDGAAPGEPHDGDWPPLATVTPTAWREARHALTAANRDLCARVRTLGAGDLERTVGSGRSPALGTGLAYADMLAGLAQHHAYHGGQIARMVRGLRV